jgi:hypothetical protein
MAAGILDSYEQERKPHTRQLIRLALNVGRSMTGGGRLGNVVRRLVLPRLRLLPGLRDKVVDSTTPALRRSALVHKSRRPRQLAGTLCPNPPLPSGQRLDDAVGAGFVFITTSPLGDADEALLRRRGVAVLVAHRDTELEKWLHRARVAAATVRPDRTVMRAGRDPAALCAWTATVLHDR